MTELEISLFNKKIGLLLRHIRMYSKTDIESIGSVIDFKELQKIEAGNKSISCRVLYELLNIYRPKEEVLLYFCCPQLLLKQENEEFKFLN